MLIRRFKKEDAEHVSRIIIENLRTINSKDYPIEAIESLITRNTPESLIEKSKTRTLLVAKEGEIIGTASLKGNEVKSVFVSPIHHKKGIGRKLMEEIEKIAKKKGVKTISLNASISAVGFYYKLGYIPVKEITEELGGAKVKMYKMKKEFSK